MTPARYAPRRMLYRAIEDGGQGGSSKVMPSHANRRMRFLTEKRASETPILLVNIAPRLPRNRRERDFTLSTSTRSLEQNPMNVLFFPFRSTVLRYPSVWMSPSQYANSCVLQSSTSTEV